MLWRRRPRCRLLSTTIDYSHYLTKRSLARQPSAIRALQPLVSLPGMISLGGGMPNPATFPFAKVTIELKGEGSESIELSGKTLEAALQYSPTPGVPSLVNNLQRLQDAEHGVAKDRLVCVTTGSADALSKTFDALVGEEDALLVESATYSGTLAYLQPIGCQLVGVDCDGDGMVPEALERVLRNWDEMREGRARPRVLYTIPNGGNPTGASLTLLRKQRIYELARQYSLLILEDDPYHWLQYTEQRCPSLLSMDVDGRVLRFDSFSKLLASGIRLGWATGPSALIERIQLHTQASNLHTCGLSQTLVSALLDRWADTHEGGLRASAGLDRSVMHRALLPCCCALPFLHSLFRIILLPQLPCCLAVLLPALIIQSLSAGWRLAPPQMQALRRTCGESPSSTRRSAKHSFAPPRRTSPGSPSGRRPRAACSSG